jgi:hypothetical protein
VIPARPQSAGLREVHVVWALFGLTAVAVFATYWRIPPQELWKVHNSGFIGGASRAFVFLSFSAALAAVAVVAIVADRLERRSARLAGVVAVALCATVAIPGVQTESHLDPKWANLPAVLGVGVALVLTVWATLEGRRERPGTTRAGDIARLAVGAAALLFAAPYVAAELGFFLDGVPLLGWFFQTGMARPEPGSGMVHAAVHHGHHHGIDGFLLAVTALLLSRLLGTIRRPLLRTATSVYLALMLVYGLTNEVEDLWIEQVVKRDWTSWQIPNVLHPSLSAAWAAMVACALVIYAAWLRPRRPFDRYRPDVGSTSSIHSDIGT